MAYENSDVEVTGLDGGIQIEDGKTSEFITIPIVARVFLYILAGAVFLLCIGQVVGTTIDSIIFDDDHKYLFFPGFAIVLILAAGCVGAASVGRSKPSTTVAWCITHWVLLALIIIDVIVIGCLRSFTISIAVISSSAVVHLAFCILYTVVCTARRSKYEQAMLGRASKL